MLVQILIDFSPFFSHRNKAKFSLTLCLFRGYLNAGWTLGFAELVQVQIWAFQVAFFSKNRLGVLYFGHKLDLKHLTQDFEWVWIMELDDLNLEQK